MPGCRALPRSARILAKAASVNPTFRVFRGSGGCGAGPGFRRVLAWTDAIALSANSGQWVGTGLRIAQAPSIRRLTATPRPVILAAMNEYEIAGLAASRMAAWASVASAAAAAVAALGIWVFGIGMMRSNTRRAETEKDRHTQIMTAFKDAAEDRKAAQAQMAQAATQAAEDRKVTQGILVALQELIRRTSPPQPGPAE